MTNMPQVQLDDVCEFIVDCLHNTAPIQSLGIPLIRTPDIGKGRLLINEAYRVSEETYDIWTRRAVPEPGDLILAREASAGNVAIIREGQKVCLGQRTVHIRPDRSKVDPNFLCYYLLAPAQQGKLLAGETGATSKHVNMRDIRKLNLGSLPSLPNQRKMGLLLAEYDDLIGNNGVRIALLEECARELYKEWFVRLRFPGYMKTSIHNGVPEGWEKKTAFDIMEIQSGGTPSTTNSSFWDGEIPFYTPRDSPENIFVFDTERYLTDEGLRGCNSRLFPRWTIFISARGTVGKLALASQPMAMNQTCYALISKGGFSQQFLYCMLESSIAHFRGQASGAVFDAIVIDTFKKISLLIPSNSILSEFEKIIAPIFQQIENLTLQNIHIQEARDILLPKLMSGEIKV